MHYFTRTILLQILKSNPSSVILSNTRPSSENLSCTLLLPGPSWCIVLSCSVSLLCDSDQCILCEDYPVNLVLADKMELFAKTEEDSSERYSIVCVCVQRP